MASPISKLALTWWPLALEAQHGFQWARSKRGQQPEGLEHKRERCAAMVFSWVRDGVQSYGLEIQSVRKWGVKGLSVSGLHFPECSVPWATSCRRLGP
jgi:hypothetical protein